jgi:hypothetical protein
MLLDKKLVKELNKLKVTIVPKMDSLYNEKYQNWVVGDKTNTYFKKRNQAIELLMKEGFNKIEKELGNNERIKQDIESIKQIMYTSC